MLQSKLSMQAQNIHFHNIVNLIINTNRIDARSISLIEDFGFTEAEAISFLMKLKKPNFTLYKIKSTPNIARLYKKQFEREIDTNKDELILDFFLTEGYSDSYEGYFYSFHNFGILSEKEIEELLMSDEYPKIFTHIEWISYDSGGLICLSFHFKGGHFLYSCNGRFIDCAVSEFNIVELIPIPYGGYLVDVPPPDSELHGAYLSDYEFYLENELFGYHFKTRTYDCNVNYSSFERINLAYFNFWEENRPHKLEIEEGTNFNIRIENFKTPQSRSEALLILEDRHCNYLTSPELSFWYSFDKELALIVLRKCPSAIALLDFSLLVDYEIINALNSIKTKMNEGNTYTAPLNYINHNQLQIKKALSCLIMKFQAFEEHITESRGTPEDEEFPF